MCAILGTIGPVFFLLLSSKQRFLLYCLGVHLARRFSLLHICLFQWFYLEHHGLLFTPPYEPHSIPVVFRGEDIVLPPEAEEVANYWCQAMDSDYGSKPKFIKNFWHALISRLPDHHMLRKQKAKFEEVDFTAIKSVCSQP